MRVERRCMGPTAFFAIPGDLATLTGGYGYDRRILALAPTLAHLQLPDGFPFPTDAAISDTLRLLRETGDSEALVVDGLALGALPPDAIAEFSKRLVAVVHHPLGLETGLDSETSRRLIANERATLVHARAVIVTSDTTAATLVADFAVPASKITVAEPGVDRATRARGSGAGAPSLLTVGSIVPRKGFDVLIDALTRLKCADWRLILVGSSERDRNCAAALRQQIEASGLGPRIAIEGEMGPERLAGFYDGADLFVLSSHYEGYGMVLAEAMARGLPIVMTTGGAAARTVPDAAALKVSPGDADALAGALAQALDDGALRWRLADESWRAGQRLPRWEDTAAKVRAVIDGIAGTLG